MIHESVSTEIDAPASAVFAFLDDESKTPLWLERCVEIHRTSAGPKAAGTTLHYTYREGKRTGTMDGEVTVHEPGRKLVMHFSDRMLLVDISFVLKQLSATRTGVEHTVEIRPRHMVMKLIQPLVRRALKKQMPKDIAKLKAEVRAQPAP